MGALSGIGSLIGGAGKSALDYGAQIRSVLESRRHALADLMTQTAATVPDPALRAEYLGHASDLYGGVPIDKILPKLGKTIHGHAEGDHSLASLVGTPAQPPQQPGPTPPGQTPGTAMQPAAQPAQSPIAPGSVAPGIQPVQPSPQQSSPQQAPEQAPAQVPAQAPIPPVQSGPSFPTIQSAQDIYKKYSALPEFSTPAGFARLKPLMDQEIAHNAALEQQVSFLNTQLSFKRQGVDAMKKTGEWDKLQPYQKAAYEAEASGLSPVNVPGYALIPHVISPSTPGSSAPPGTKDGSGNPIDATIPYRIISDMMRGEVWEPLSVRGVSTQTAGGGVQFSSPYKLGAVPGAVAPALNTPHFQPTAGGGVEMIQPSALTQGAPPTGPVPVPGAVSPSMLPQVSSTTTQVPGQLPSTTRRTVTKGAGGALPQPGASAPAPGVVPPVSSGSDSLEAQKYADWVSGKVIPTGKELTAVQSYAQQKGLPTPSALSAQGQKDVSQLDEVLSQIKTLKGLMEQRGLDKDQTHKTYQDYFRYAHLGEATPNQDLWTGLSFESLRSAAAALKGSNSRAYQFIQRALDHTPRPQAGATHLPDTPANMYGKLKEMEQILSTGRENVLQDERKGGIIPPVSPGNGPTDDVKARLIEKYGLGK